MKTILADAVRFETSCCVYKCMYVGSYIAMQYALTHAYVQLKW